MPGGPRESKSGGPGVWQREYFDRYIRDAGHYASAVDYIHENPVMAGLVESAVDWPYSSVCITPQWCIQEGGQVLA